jgi:hypothetical protein
MCFFLLDSLRSREAKMKVLDKVFVVSGGGSGMGRELVLLLIKKRCPRSRC